MTCPICITQYNKTINSCVVCPDETCGYHACKQCVRTYLLETTQDPHCMNCRKTFEQKFIVENLNSTWVKSTYQNHKKRLLFERELSKIPQTMQFVENYRRVNELKKQQQECQEKIASIESQIINANAKNCYISKNQKNIEKLIENETDDKVKEKLNSEHDNYTCEKLKINEELNVLAKQINELTMQKNQIIKTKKNILNGTTPVQENKKQFIMPCSDKECRGFLSTAYKCNACLKFTCSKCHEVIGINKEESQHVCNQDSIKSAELIKKDSKPCPTCGERICKISGCDQMWCPTCQTAFSWKTGKIDNGVIHNPHYYQWQRTNNNAIRNPGDVVCGGLVNWWNIYHPILHLTQKTLGGGQGPFYVKIFMIVNEMSRYHQHISHVTNSTIDRLRENLRDNDSNRNLRISYIVKEISEKQFSSAIVKNDNIRKKNTEILHVWELVQTVAIESFNTCANKMEKRTNSYRVLLSGLLNTPSLISLQDIRKYCEAFINFCEGLLKTFQHEIAAIVEYANSQFEIISATFNYCTPKLSNTLVESRQKANQSILKGNPKASSNKDANKDTSKAENKHSNKMERNALINMLAAK